MCKKLIFLISFVLVLGIVSSTYGQECPDDANMIAWWPMDEDIDPCDVIDISGNEYHGTREGLDGGPTWTMEAKEGTHALEFVGGFEEPQGRMDIQWVKVDHDIKSALDDPNRHEAVTFAAWGYSRQWTHAWTAYFKVDGYEGAFHGPGSMAWTVVRGNPDPFAPPEGQFPQPHLRIVGSEVDWVPFYGDPPGNPNEPPFPLPLETWYHLATTYQAGDPCEGIPNRVTNYVNGMPYSMYEFGPFDMNSTVNLPRMSIGAGANEGIDADFWVDIWNGMLDDMRIYDYALTDEQIKCAFLPYGKAMNPNPPNGEQNVDPFDVTLSWEAAAGADHHDVFFAEGDEEAVANATDANVYPGLFRQDPCEKFVGDLLLGKTYFWKIAEINEPGEGLMAEADVWSFSTIPYVTFEDFEQYDLIDPPYIESFWTHNLGVGVGLVWLEQEFGEGEPPPVINQAGGFDLYDWQNPYISIVTRDIEADGPGVMDFSVGGEVRILSVDIHGDTTNDVGREDLDFYIQLVDSVASGSTVSARVDLPLELLTKGTPEDPNWTTVYIPLSDFDTAGFDITAVGKVQIILGDGVMRPQQDTSWCWVYFDNFLLRPPWCRLEFSPPADVTGDCLVNYDDIFAVSADWLDMDAWQYRATPAEDPTDANLIAYWSFDEGEGLTAGESINAFNGALSSPNSPTWVGMPEAHDGNALDYAGGLPEPIPTNAVNWVFVDANMVGPDDGSITDGNAVTMSAWIMYRSKPHIFAAIFKNFPWEHPEHGARPGMLNFCLNPENLVTVWLNAVTDGFAGPAPAGPFPPYPLEPGVMYHVAFTYENMGPFSPIFIYVDGCIYGMHEYGGDPPGGPIDIGPGFFATSVFPWSEPAETFGDFMVDFYDGIIDEVKIYNRALTAEEITWLSESEAPKFWPLESPANVHPTGYPEIIDFRDYSIVADEPTWMKDFYWPPE